MRSCKGNGPSRPFETDVPVIKDRVAGFGAAPAGF